MPVTSTGMYLLQYRHHGSTRSALFQYSRDARAWGEYCFYSLKGCTGARVIDLVRNIQTWSLGSFDPIDWNHNEAE